MLTGLCAGLVALAAAPAATAEIVSSQIVAPPGPVFAIDDGADTIAVSGTTTGGSPGDKVDLACFYDSGGVRQNALLATEVGLNPDGTFSEPAADLTGLAARVCRLRAVPAGTEPDPDFSFAGPAMAIGESWTAAIGAGPNTGIQRDYGVWAQQLTAASELVSAGSCGISESVLYDAGFEATTSTFACADYWNSVNAFPASGSTRSELQVDGANAYVPGNASDVNVNASGYPALTVSFVQNPLNGDVTIEESDPIVRCPSPDYPPATSSCPSFVGTGVRVERTIEQTDDGHLVTIADRFFSTDGQPHTVDLLPENAQGFGVNNGEDIAYRFPGEASYSTRDQGAVVSFPDASPGAVLIEVEGSPDGDPTTGRGAIVFDGPASPATFKLVHPPSSQFFFQQTVSVPATGAALVRFAYVQAYDQAEVDALVEEAEAAFALTPTPPTPGPPAETPASTPVLSPPSNAIELLRIKRDSRTGTARIAVGVPGAGNLVLSGKKVRTVRRRPGEAGIVVLRVVPRRRFGKLLEEAGSLRVALKIAFTPAGGETGARRKKLKLIERG